MEKEGEESNLKGVKGRVIKNTGNTYLVRTASGSDLICKAKGTFD